MAILVAGEAMVFSFLVLKARLAPIILGMDFEKQYARAIYVGAETLPWYDDSVTEAI